MNNAQSSPASEKRPAAAVSHDLKGESGLAAIIPEVFYDIIALLIPGFAVICFFYYLAVDPLPLPRTSADFAVHILLSYAIGHLLYAFAIVIFDLIGLESPRKTLIDAAEQEAAATKGLFRLFKPTFTSSVRTLLRAEIESRWRLPSDAFDGQLYYELCRHYVSIRSPDRGRFIRKEQAYGELFRALTLLGIVFAIFGIWSSKYPWITFCFSLLVAIISFYRYIYARAIDAFFVYLTFHIIATSEGCVIDEGETNVQE